MKIWSLVWPALMAATLCQAQDIDKIITPAEVERIERILSSDDMQGRKIYTPAIDKAADFIAEEFKKAGLQPVSGQSYLQEFTLLRTKMISANATVNGKAVEAKNVFAVSSQPSLSITENSGYEVISLDAKAQLFNVIQHLSSADKNYLLRVEPAQEQRFSVMKRFLDQIFPSEKNVVVVLTADTPTTFKIDYTQEITSMKLKNVAGVLPGNSKPGEQVIFSAHYDHLGVGKPNEAKDSIFNGANDDAAGTTAVMMLAKYFAQKKDNARTLVFAAFTAEEIGGFGSKYFSRQFNPEKVMAMFNIEMIGTDSKWGKNSAYITGYEKTDMGKILEKNLEGSNFKFYADPYSQMQLFYRSDNATLARLGVPAHTISTSKMDEEKNYHTAEDEIETLDMKNMAEIIKAIAISSTSIVAGKDTPSRVDTKDLQ